MNSNLLQILVIVLLVTAFVSSERHQSSRRKRSNHNNPQNNKCDQGNCTKQFGDDFGDPRIYAFAFTQIAPGSFFDGNDVVGARVELMKEVCCRAEKRCVAAMVDFVRCYNGDNLSEVLNGRWYDGCIEVSDTPRRKTGYAFGDIKFFELPNPVIIVSPASNVTLADLLNPRNTLKVAYLSNPELATSAILEKFLEEYFVQPENVIPVGAGSANENVDEILRLINDPCSGVQVGLVALHLIKPGDPFVILDEIELALGKSTIMVRKDEQDILDWWDFALRQFMCSDEFVEFCNRMDMEFGANPLNCPDPSQVDCSNDCTGDKRVPACRCQK